MQILRSATLMRVQAMITTPKECPSDAELMRIITAIKVIHGVDVFMSDRSGRGYPANGTWIAYKWKNLATVRKYYRDFSFWLSAEFGELSNYADTGVKDQSNTGQSFEGDQGGMVLQPSSGAVWQGWNT